MNKKSKRRLRSPRGFSKNFYEARFAEERLSYLNHLLARGWALNTVICIGVKISAFAIRVDIRTGPGITLSQIEAAADNWMKTARHSFNRKIGPHKARTKFITNAKDWLRFLGRYIEPTPKLVPCDKIIDEYKTFLHEEIGLSRRSIHTYSWNIGQLLGWLNATPRTLKNVKINDLELFLARPRERPYSRKMVSSFVGAFRSFFRFAELKKYSPANIAQALDAPRIYYQETLPLGPSWPDVRRMIIQHWRYECKGHPRPSHPHSVGYLWISCWRSMPFTTRRLRLATRAN